MMICVRNETHCQSESLCIYAFGSGVCRQHGTNKVVQVTQPPYIFDEVTDTVHYRHDRGGGLAQGLSI